MVSDAEQQRAEMAAVVKRQNAERKADFPDWPTHHQEMIFRGKTVWTYEAVPVCRIERARGRCKYCYTTHRNWWLMDQRDYQCDGETIILCGECEHTSIMSYTGMGRRHERPWLDPDTTRH